jgi:hypothetical protein
MQELDDQALLRRFATEASDEAFAALVQHHLNLVYGVALRQVGKLRRRLECSTGKMEQQDLTHR